MDKWLFLIVLSCFLFCLTYDPKTRGLEKYMINPSVAMPSPQQSCCNNLNYRAENMRQCSPPYYQALQLGDKDLGCPSKHPKADLGAIIHR